MSFTPPPADISGFEPPQSLWALVENNVPASEREEVKIMMGESLVEQSLELHEEINLLLEIWRDYRQETAQISCANRAFLPEPPAARERLVQEIRFFVDSIKEKAAYNQRDADKILCRHNSDVLEYIMENKRPSSTGSRPSTARSSADGRETPLRRSTPGSDRMSGLSGCSNMSEEVESIKDKLNVSKFDDVCQHLRETLEEEVIQILDDINFLQSCLDDEAEYRASSSMAVEGPSLSDLREERSKLEKDYMGDELEKDIFVVNRNDNKALSSNPLLNSRRLPKALAPTSVGRICSKSSSPSVSQKPCPLKASHQLGTQILSVHSDHSSKDNVGTGRLKNGMPLQAGSGKEKSSTNGPELDKVHVTVRNEDANALHSVKVVKVRSTKVLKPGEPHVESMIHTPSPPSSAKPTTHVRPGSAERFRKMVVQCRDGK